MVRGLRAVTDFENEIQLAHTNFAMMPEIETVFLATAIKWSYLSSTIVREAAHYGQDVSRFVPATWSVRSLPSARQGSCKPHSSRVFRRPENKLLLNSPSKERIFRRLLMKKIVIASACRTAIGKFGGTLANVPAAELGSIVIKEL